MSWKGLSEEDRRDITLHCLNMDHALRMADARLKALNSNPPELGDVLEREAQRRELPAYMRSVPGVVAV